MNKSYQKQFKDKFAELKTKDKSAFYVIDENEETKNPFFEIGEEYFVRTTIVTSNGIYPAVFPVGKEIDGISVRVCDSIWKCLLLALCMIPEMESEEIESDIEDDSEEDLPKQSSEEDSEEVAKMDIALTSICKRYNLDIHKVKQTYQLNSEPDKKKYQLAIREVPNYVEKKFNIEGWKKK